MTLGDIIKEYRTAHGFSQDVIASRSNLSKAYISILERNRNPKTGEPPVASLKTIKAIAAAIESDFDTVFSKLDRNLRVSISEQMPPAYDPNDNETGSPAKKQILEAIDSLNDDQVSAISSFIKYLTEK